MAASLTSGAANLYGPPAVDGRRVEARVEGRGDDSVAVGEHTATGLDWERKEKGKNERPVTSTSTSIRLLAALHQRSGSRSPESGGEGGNSVHGRVITHR